MPPSGTLGEILEATRERVLALEATRPPAVAPVELAKASPRTRPARPSLREALSGGGKVAVIGEIKRRSPSKGDLHPALSAAVQAGLYQRGGAAAVSVLTEPTRFGGSLQDLRDAAAACDLPLLKKDFHIALSQLPEAFDAQASALLLIARALPPHELLSLMRRANDAGMETVVEVRSEEELEAALRGGATIVGVNSRDLETLEVDDDVPARLIPRIPAGVVAIWESGVGTVAHVQRAADAGADAVLVGSALSRSTDPEGLVRQLASVPRKPRHG
ncbi:MAG: indole-3-glycerol phosphate synthase TrpC [Gemmatimonadaceae bacterium]